MRWLVRNSLVIALLLTFGTGWANAVAQEATPATTIESNGLFTSSLDLIQPAPIGAFPDGEADTLAEVGRSVAPDGSGLLLVVRNNTTESVRRATASARVSSDGSVVALGASSTLMPSEVAPSGLALMVVSFDDAELDPTLILTAEVRVETSGEPTFYGWETVDVLDVVVGTDQVLLSLASRSGGGLSTASEDVVIVCLANEDADTSIKTWAVFQIGELIERDRAATAVVGKGIDGCDGPVIAAAIGTDGQY